MVKFTRVIIIVLLVGLFIFGGFCAFIFMHEQAHVQINAYYGIKSEVHYGLFVATTIGDKPCPNDTCIALHSLNEIVSYPYKYF